MRIRIGHSRDVADAFMLYALTEGHVEAGPFELEFIDQDMHLLDERAQRGELEMTTLSPPAWAAAGQYALLGTGGRFGMDQGPIIVASRLFNVIEMPYRTLALPGDRTTAWLLAHLLVKEPQYAVLPPNEIPDAVLDGQVDAGVLDDEDQLTYREQGLEPILNLGKWWFSQTRLPLPLRVQGVRRDLGPEVAETLADRLHESIRYALHHAEDALEYAYNRTGEEYGLRPQHVKQFVDLYVHRLSLEMTDSAARGLQTLLERGAQAGLIPAVERLEWV